MLYTEIIAVYSQMHTKHINTLCGQNVEFLHVKPGGTYSNHWALNGYRRQFTRTGHDSEWEDDHKWSKRQASQQGHVQDSDRMHLGYRCTNLFPPRLHLAGSG
jgi:hypothetical protein